MTKSTLEYSMNTINKAGKALSGVGGQGIDQNEAIEILENFRSIHNYPLYNFRVLLHRKAKIISKDILISQRLKRAPSIVNKLKIQKNMSLARMQDIGGLRAIVNSLEEVYDLKDAVRLSEEQPGFKSSFVREYDYIQKPKESGYISVHLIYKYDKNVTEKRQCRIEIQIRTKIQHAWATAVEVIGTYLRQPLKQSFGNKELLNLFKEISKVFVFLEKNEIDIDLFKKTNQKIQDLKLIDMLQAFSVITDESKEKAGKYVLIQLNFEKKTLTTRRYTTPRFEEANNEYSELEKKYLNNKNIEVVLVSVDDINNLRKLYPNYFLDTAEFIKLLDNISQKIKENEN